MKDMKTVEKKIKDDLRQASRKSREDMDAAARQRNSRSPRERRLKPMTWNGRSAMSVSEPKLHILPSSINLKKMWNLKQKN